MTARVFTPDELRVVLKWALAWHDWPEHDPSIGQDTMFSQELAALRDKLADADGRIILGGLNACFLLGFAVFDTPYPLQEVWDTVIGLIEFGMHDKEQTDQVNKLQRFLEDASLIEREKTDGQS